MWNKLSFENKMEAALKAQFGNDTGEKYFTQYTSARDYLIANIFPQIRGIEPSLSEHDATHIANVLNNAEHLIGDAIDFTGNSQEKKLKGIDLYLLGLVIVFHDVGNVHGRQNHADYKNIATVYNEVRNLDPKYNHERTQVVLAASAHSSAGKRNSPDTLKQLDEHSSLYNNRVYLRDVAAILRFADELAEGPQRTSSFMQKYHKYDPESMIFHRYANITEILIDKPNERIAITYSIDLDKKGENLNDEEEQKFKELILFTYKRILKLDQERKYTKCYSDFLTPFKRTSVKFNISLNHELQDLDLQDLILTDVTVPGEACKEIAERDPSYAIENIIQKLNS